jgi:hypothetical protein
MRAASREIHCCGCNQAVQARLTNGSEIYPRRADLSSLPFWKCDTCGNFVGCHHKTEDRTRPLGCIPTPELKDARQKIHALIDPLWQGGTITRKALYAQLTKALGRQYHTAELRSLDEARLVYRTALNLKPKEMR